MRPHSPKILGSYFSAIAPKRLITSLSSSVSLQTDFWIFLLSVAIVASYPRHALSKMLILIISEVLVLPRHAAHLPQVLSPTKLLGKAHHQEQWWQRQEDQVCQLLCQIPTVNWP